MLFLTALKTVFSDRYYLFIYRTLMTKELSIKD